MTTAREQMKMIESELSRIRAELAKLKAQEEVLLGLQSRMNGDPNLVPARKRSPAIKPLVLDILTFAAFTGATSGEVDQTVRRSVPTVAKDTVGSVLSRLKSDGALAYDGERYYVKEYAPRPSAPFEGNMRAVN